MIRNILSLILLAICMQGVFAQDIIDNNDRTKSLFEEITKIKKKTDKFNLYLHMNGSFDANFSEGEMQQSHFKMRQLRIEAKGQINEWLSYRWRQRLNRSNAHNSFDNLSTAIDYAAIGVSLGKWSFLVGKQCTNYGGIEFDLNPIEIYQYCDMIDYMNSFQWGVNVGYKLTPSQQLNFQIVNSQNGNWENIYGGEPTDGLEMTKLPLIYTLLWVGNFNNCFKTRWSASIWNQAKDNIRYYFALGNQLDVNKFNMYFDIMYSRDGLDYNGIITKYVGKQGGHNAFNSSYLSFVTKMNYRFHPKWSVFVKGMYETASIYKGYGDVSKGKYRTSLGYLGGLEFYPMRKGLHFFLTYVGRSYIFEDRANESDYSTNRISVGFIYPMQIF